MKKQINAIKDELFSKVHGNNLVYNTCWEDPKIDRELLQIDNSSEIVMITSAGCNALEYLLDNPKKNQCCRCEFSSKFSIGIEKGYVSLE